uniref:J domain-containing protein n=1 Tax=viral metagenome TaxID=1070528 RepID=A0A6C0HDI6_9ZZZZ
MNKNLDFDLDLDINNYNLQDILNLFKIPTGFTESDLKKAKTIVLKTHPDKSGLNPDFFRFYSKAYKMLYSVWEFRKKGDVNTGAKKNTDYSTYGDDEKRELLDQMFENNEKFKNKSQFNRWFNEQFERNKLYNENQEKGYEEWLRSNEEDNDNSPKNVTMENMGREFEKKKSRARSLIVHQEVQEIYGVNSISASDLSSDAPQSFDSDLFSSLPFQDLRQAHTETVVPVTFEDYQQKQKFNSVNEMISHRSQQNIKPLSEQQALNYLKNREKNDEERSVRRAYDLAKQTELAQQRSQDFWSSIQMLKNGK